MWAVAEGVRAAASDYLLLTDADIVHPPEHLADLVARAQQGDYDLVSYMVRLQCRTLAEQALIPAFVFFFFLLYPPAWIRDPRRRTAGAAGGCILIRRAALERIGGIARIRGELIDDCALARAVKQSGGRVWLGLSGTAASIRPYRTFGEIGRMISRTAFTQLGHSVPPVNRHRRGTGPDLSRAATLDPRRPARSSLRHGSHGVAPHDRGLLALRALRQPPLVLGPPAAGHRTLLYGSNPALRHRPHPGPRRPCGKAAPRIRGLDCCVSLPAFLVFSASRRLRVEVPSNLRALAMHLVLPSVLTTPLEA